MASGWAVLTLEKVLSLGTTGRRLGRKERVFGRASVQKMTNLRPPTREILREQTFLTMLGLEHRRVKRARKSFVLILLDVETLLKRDTRNGILSELALALSSSTRDTDQMGWYQTDKLLGVVCTEVSLEKEEVASKVLQTRMVKAVQNQLGIHRSSKIHLTIHAGQTLLESEPLATVAS
jgi:hypothetical protein